MRSIFALLILAGTLTSLAGCRTESGSAPASQAEDGSNSPGSKTLEIPSEPSVAPRDAGTARASTSTHDGRPLIVCFGDSLTAGFGADEGASYPDFLQKDLDRRGFKYRVVNEGISGNTTKDGLNRLAGIIDEKPAIVVLEFGGNDGLRGLKVQTTRANLSTMITGLKASGVKVVLAGITLPPDYGPDYVSSFTASYPTLAKKYNVPLLPFLLKNVYGVDGMMQADHIHATARGNELVAKNVLPLVTPLLSK